VERHIFGIKQYIYILKKQGGEKKRTPALVFLYIISGM
jgi:hypothetical protein